MRGYGIYVGPIFILVGLLLGAGMGVYFWSGYHEHALTLPGALLGVMLFSLFPLLAFTGVGTYLYFSGRLERRHASRVMQKEYLLGVLQAQGKISLQELMSKMNLPKEQISSMVYELVQMGLFAGYIDWKQEVLFSQDVSLIQNACLQCGATKEIVGKGTWVCSHCGAETFLPSRSTR